MNTNFSRFGLAGSDKARKPARRPSAMDEAKPPRMPPFPGRACCCLAKPVVVAMMPVTGQRSTPVDIHLCAHHYRASRKALAQAGAIVFDRNGALVSGTDAFELV